jgi:hypothetical protein
LIQKTFDILKMRWPEVMLVVVLQAAITLSANEIAVSLIEESQFNIESVSSELNFFFGLCLMTIWILWLMLYTGFLKTLAVSETQPFRPLDLLREGVPYYWRFLLLGILVMFLVGLSFIGFAFSLGSMIWKTSDWLQMPGWFLVVCEIAATLAFIKLSLFVSARIITCDESVPEALRWHRLYRVGDIEGLPKAIFIGFSAILIISIINSFVPETPVLYYTVAGIQLIINYGVMFFLTAMVVLYIQWQLEAEYQRLNEEEGNE